MTDNPSPTRGIAAILMSVVLLVSVTTPVAALYDPDTDGDVTPLSNPDFPQLCAVDVYVLIDTSASTEGDLPNYKQAARNFAAQLPDGSRVGIIEFNETASTRLVLTPVASDLSTINSTIDALQSRTGESNTNWEAPLLEASQAFGPSDANKPADLVILLSDGEPNAYGYPLLEGLDAGSTAVDEPLEAGTFAANEVKEEGTRVVGIGPGVTGEDAVDAFENATGTTEYDGVVDPQDADFFLPDDTLTGVDTVFQLIADEVACGIAVEKTNDASGNDSFTDDVTEEIADEGDAVPYMVVVENTGQIDLNLSSYDDVFEGSARAVTLYSDAGLTDEVTPAELQLVELAPGESTTFYFEDLAPDDGPFQASYENVVEFVAVDDDGNTVSDDDPTAFAVNDILPELSIVKDVKEADSADAFANSTTVAPGSDVVYRVTISNPADAFETVDLVDYEDIVEGAESEPALFSDEALTTSIDLTAVSLAPGESVTVYFAGSAPAADDDSLVDTFRVDGQDDEDNTITVDDPARVDTSPVPPELSIVKDVKEADSADAFANSTTVAPGSDVVYRVVVSNPADAFETVDLTDYEDVIEGVEGEPDLYTDEALSSAIDLTTVSLAPGESVTVYFGGSAPAADDDSLEDTFRVDGQDDDGQTVTVDDPARVDTSPVPPELSIVKDVKEADSADAFANATSVAPGSDVVYRVTISNPADAFETVDLVDYEDIVEGAESEPDLYTDESLTTGIDLTTVSLAPGESVTVYFGGTAPAADDASLEDTFRVDGVDDDGQTVTVDDPARVDTDPVPPELSIVKDVKEAGSADAFANATSVAPGSDVVYRVVVSNPADAFETVDLTDYEDIVEGAESEPALFSDEALTTSIDLTAVSLAPGESVTVYFGGTAPAADDASLEDTFRVDGQDDDGQTVTVDDPARVDTPAIPPELAVTKYVDANGDMSFADDVEEANNPIDSVVYRVVISNPADAFETVDLTGYQDVVDGGSATMPALYSDYALTTPVVLTTVSLAPGESTTVYFAGSAPDAFGASSTDVFTVDGEDDDGQTVSDDDDATVTTPAAEQICPRTPGFWSTHNGGYATGNNFDFTTGSGDYPALLPITLGDGTGESVVVDSDDVANDVFRAQLTADSHKSNGISKLYIHLLAAKLNTANGAVAPDEVLDAIERSDEILTAYDESDWDDIRKNDRALAEEIGDLKDLLDRFNNRAFSGADCIEDWWKEDAQ